MMMFVAAVAMMFASCDKDDDNNNNGGGNSGSGSNELRGTSWMLDEPEDAVYHTHVVYTVTFDQADGVVFNRNVGGTDVAMAGTYEYSGGNGTAFLKYTSGEDQSEYRMRFSVSGNTMDFQVSTRTITLTKVGTTPDPDPDPSTAEWVDLGLPSGLLWASRNLGADDPEEYGNYYAWGETQPKTVYNYDTYAFCDDMGSLTKYCNNSDFGRNGFADTLVFLLPEDDAATVALGEGVRMPTKAEWEELINNCTSELETLNGINGYRLTGPNGRSIFLPMAGLHDDAGADEATDPIAVGEQGSYWANMMDDDWNPATAWTFNINTAANGLGMTAIGRTAGQSVRPVRVAQ